MIAKDIFPGLKLDKKVAGIKVKALSMDSRLVNRGDVFFVVGGQSFDVLSVLRQIEHKVSLFVADRKSRRKIEDLKIKKPIVFVKDIADVFYSSVDKFYGFKNKDLDIIGITGTNGKTTMAFLIYYLLNSFGVKVSLVGTIKHLVGNNILKANHTTPDFLTLRKILQQAKNKGSRFVVMEVSSHALDQNRIKGIDFAMCVFTNLSRDHFDYHKTLRAYSDAKKKLFMDNLKATSVINTDDGYGRKIFTKLSNKISYGTGPCADFRACNITLSKKGCRFKVGYSGESYLAETKLYGKHNILNILGALGVVSTLGFSIRKALDFLKDFDCVEGRLELVAKNIFLDYAHTPDALSNALSALKYSGYKNIICVFGCGGDRDKGKRRMMGRISSLHSHFTFITSDNPRSEIPDSICHQIEKGFEDKKYSIVLDRFEAIRQAIDMLLQRGAFCGKKINKSDSCVLIAGKGHEKYQVVAGAKIPFDDAQVVREILRKITR